MSVRQIPLDTPAHFSTGRHKKDKKWSFVESLKKDAFGIASLRENGILKTDTKEKANVCYRQFQSAFTRKGDSYPPSKGASPFPPMGDITVDPKGVAKLLDELHVLFFFFKILYLKTFKVYIPIFLCFKDISFTVVLFDFWNPCKRLQKM